MINWLVAGQRVFQQLNGTLFFQRFTVQPGINKDVGGEKKDALKRFGSGCDHG